MKNRSLQSFVGLALVMALSACSKYYHNPAPQVMPQNLQKIAVRPIENRTNRVGLKDRFTVAIHSAFNRDGRWAIVDESEADGVLIGEITRYIIMPLKHDSNNVPIEYKILILVDISFYDKTRNQTLWTEKNLEATLTAPPSSTGLPGALTETEAQEILWEKLAKDITTRTFEGFGTVTGMSEKAAPKSSPAPTLPPTPPPETFQ